MDRRFRFGQGGHAHAGQKDQLHCVDDGEGTAGAGRQAKGVARNRIEVKAVIWRPFRLPVAAPLEGFKGDFNQLPAIRVIDKAGEPALGAVTVQGGIAIVEDFELHLGGGIATEEPETDGVVFAPILPNPIHAVV